MYKMMYRYRFSIDCLTSLILFAVFCLSKAESPKQAGNNQIQFPTTGSNCITPNQKIGHCTSIKACTDLLWLLTNKKNDQKAMNFLRESQCGFENNLPKVCCRSYRPVTPTKPVLHKYEDCGMNEVTHRIIGGETTQAGDYPWMASLGYRKKSNPGPEWYCGGALISEKYVLTAAHCVTGISPWELYMVRLGDVNLDDSVEDNATPLNAYVQNIKMHERYTNNPVTNDIALLKLRQNIHFSPFIKPICLPENTDFHKNILDNQMGYVAGWGRTSLDGPFSPVLLDLKLPIQNIEICKNAYSGRPGSHVDDRNLCAGYLNGGKDSCQGDSGGPLMWTNQSDARFYIVGIVSFGIKCAERGYPGVYTRVSEYIDWISSNIS